jgi:hypothetical protein
MKTNLTAKNEPLTLAERYRAASALESLLKLLYLEEPLVRALANTGVDASQIDEVETLHDEMQRLIFACIPSIEWAGELLARRRLSTDHVPAATMAMVELPMSVRERIAPVLGDWESIYRLVTPGPEALVRASHALEMEMSALTDRSSGSGPPKGAEFMSAAARCAIYGAGIGLAIALGPVAWTLGAAGFAGAVVECL